MNAISFIVLSIQQSINHSINSILVLFLLHFLLDIIKNRPRPGLSLLKCVDSSLNESVVLHMMKNIIITFKASEISKIGIATMHTAKLVDFCSQKSY